MAMHVYEPHQNHPLAFSADVADQQYTQAYQRQPLPPPPSHTHIPTVSKVAGRGVSQSRYMYIISVAHLNGFVKQVHVPWQLPGV
jgi:hypothetical protein